MSKTSPACGLPPIGAMESGHRSGAMLVEHGFDVKESCLQYSRLKFRGMKNMSDTFDSVWIVTIIIDTSHAGTHYH